MSAQPPHWIDDETAERILDAPRDRLVSRHPVAGVISEAVASHRPGAVPGEEAALAAFFAAPLEPVPQPRRTSMLKLALAKLLTAKIAIGAATVVAAGGVAVAATSGAVPNPLAEPAPQASAGADAAENAQNRAASPSPNLVGLCQAYTRKAGDNPGKALESPAFEALIAAAGGADEVAEYCDDLLADAARGTAPAQPTGAPGDRPTGAPGDQPTGAPDGQPTGAPGDQPTGAPDDKTSRKPADPAPTSTGRP